jgi:PAS domain S-box-containing protein
MTTLRDSELGSSITGDGRGNSLELALEESELRYRRLFETAQDGILILDANTGQIIDVNPFLLDLLDYPFESMIGRRLWEIGQFKDVAANQAAFGTLQTNEYIRYENLPLRTRTGREIQVEFVSNVYFVGSAKVIQCNIRDISARAKATLAFVSRVAALELSSKAKDDVLATLSHELRTPLTAISCAADLLSLDQDESGALPGEQVATEVDRAALAIIRRNARSLVGLINDLLDLTRIVKGTVRLELERIDLHEVIRFAVRNLENQQESKAIWLKLQLHARRRLIRADAGKLEQALSNLIGNAMKFTSVGGRVSIVTSNDESDGLIVEISDTGIGISPEALERIFLPFERGDSTIHSRFGGLGLGLSIARSLMKAHGATLEATSDGMGEGAKFVARFCVDASPEAANGKNCDLP